MAEKKIQTEMNFASHSCLRKHDCFSPKNMIIYISPKKPCLRRVFLCLSISTGNWAALLKPAYFVSG